MSKDNDSRFSQLKTDPRFLEMPKKQKKVVIDKRFKAALDKDSHFNTISKVDKTGKKVKQQDKMMQEYYQLEDTDDKTGDKTKGKFYDEEGNFQWQGQSSSGDSASEEGEAEVEQEDSNEDDNVWDEDGDIPYKEATEEALGTRLALNKMDWDTITAVDLLSLFSSLCKGDHVVTKVEIYPSLFGQKRMKEDSLYGPPKAIFESEDKVKKALLKKRLRKNAKEVEESSDGELDHLEEDDPNAYNQALLRKYEV